MSAPTGKWAELLGSQRAGRYEMVRRDQIRPGDTVYSSHYGTRKVTEAFTRGIGPRGGTTELRFGEWSSGASSGIWNEQYDADSLIPRRIPKVGRTRMNSDNIAKLTEAEREEISQAVGVYGYRVFDLIEKLISDRLVAFEADLIEGHQEGRR